MDYGEPEQLGFLFKLQQQVCLHKNWSAVSLDLPIVVACRKHSQVSSFHFHPCVGLQLASCALGFSCSTKCMFPATVLQCSNSTRDLASEIGRMVRAEKSIDPSALSACFGSSTAFHTVLPYIFFFLQ